MTPEQIRKAIPTVRTAKGLMYLLNNVKRDIYGDTCYPFNMKAIFYYCNPSRSDKAYKHFKIAKKSGGFREISAPTRNLKQIQACLNVIFQALYEPTNIAKGFLPHKSVVDNAAAHIGAKYVFNTDIKDFFPSITQARVWAVLQLPPLNFTREAASLIAGFCCMQVPNPNATGSRGKYRYILPQGSPCSPILTNLVCSKLDRRLNGLAKRFDLNCTRYADDITFSSSHNIYSKDGEFFKELKRIIEGQGFRINEGKTRLQNKSMRQEVTGVTVNEKMNVSRKFVREVQSILFIWERYGYGTAMTRFGQHYAVNKPNKMVKGQDYLIRVIQGKLMYMKMIKGESDPTYRKLLSKFCRLTNKEAEADPKFEMVYTISNFEKAFNTSVHFSHKWDDISKSPNTLGAVVKYQGRFIWVVISKSCRPVIYNALHGRSDKTMTQIKDRFYIVCQKRDGRRPFWIIEKGDPRMAAKTPAVHEYDLDAATFDAFIDGGTSSEREALNSILERHVETDFSDLSILSEWEKGNKI